MLTSSLCGSQRGQDRCGAQGMLLACTLQGLFEELGDLVRMLFESWYVKGLPHPCMDRHFIWILFKKKYFKIKRGKENVSAAELEMPLCSTFTYLIPGYQEDA